MREAAGIAILTRAHEDNVELAARLGARGVAVIELPCVRVEPLADTTALAAAIRDLTPADWLVATSRAGADAVARAARPEARIAAIGTATAERLRAHGLSVDFRPSVATGECLGRELPNARVALLARSDSALSDLPRILRQRGFEVREIVAYRTVPGAEGDVGSARRALGEAGARVDIYLSSPSALDGLIEAVDAALVARATFVVTGAVTRAAVREHLGPHARIVPMEEEAHHVAHG